jgi:hypothetical protein
MVGHEPLKLSILVRSQVRQHLTFGYNNVIYLPEVDMKKLVVVSEKNGVYLINLPNGIDPGYKQAAEYFAEAVAELRDKFPGKSFSFATFDQENSTGHSNGVKTWLVVVQ